jgi:hypothetical protein
MFSVLTGVLLNLKGSKTGSDKATNKTERYKKEGLFNWYQKCRYPTKSIHVFTMLLTLVILHHRSSSNHQTASLESSYSKRPLPKSSLKISPKISTESPRCTLSGTSQYLYIGASFPDLTPYPLILLAGPAALSSAGFSGSAAACIVAFPVLLSCLFT